MDIDRNDNVQEIKIKLCQSIYTGIIFDPLRQILYTIEYSPIVRPDSVSILNRDFVLTAYDKKNKKIDSIILPKRDCPYTISCKFKYLFSNQ